LAWTASGARSAAGFYGGLAGVETALLLRTFFRERRWATCGRRTATRHRLLAGSLRL